MAQKHGNKVQIFVLLTPEQHAELEARAQRENRPVSNMAATLIGDAIRKPAKKNA